MSLGAAELEEIQQVDALLGIRIGRHGANGRQATADDADVGRVMGVRMAKAGGRRRGSRRRIVVYTDDRRFSTSVTIVVVRIGGLIVAVEARQQVVSGGRDWQRVLVVVVLRLCVSGSLQTSIHSLQVCVVLVLATGWVQIIVARHVEN